MSNESWLDDKCTEVFDAVDWWQIESQPHSYRWLVRQSPRISLVYFQPRKTQVDESYNVCHPPSVALCTVRTSEGDRLVQFCYHASAPFVAMLVVMALRRNSIIWTSLSMHSKLSTLAVFPSSSLPSLSLSLSLSHCQLKLNGWLIPS